MFDFMEAVSKFKSFMFDLKTSRNNLLTSSDYPPDKSNLEPFEQVPLGVANLLTSEKYNGKHALLLDLDTQHHYVPSTTEDHGHIYINADLDYEDMIQILEILAKHGIVQQGYLEWTKARGASSLRPPWVNKKIYAENAKDIDEIF